MDKLSGERCLVPAVNQHVERKLPRIQNPDEIRTRFLKLHIDEKSALDFLNGVGVWSAIDGEVEDGSGDSLLSGAATVGVKAMRLFGAFGHRWLDARASIETVKSLQLEQEHWRRLLHRPSRLRAAFGIEPKHDVSPHHKAAFAMESAFMNSLPVHLEWRINTPTL